MEHQQNEHLLPIRVAGEVLTVCSLDFAAGLGIQHKNLLETIRSHQREIERSFGPVAFETIAPHPSTESVAETVPTNPDQKDSAFQTRNLSESAKRRTKPATAVYMTEEQALFIGTLSRNSKRVIDFKATLVKSFVAARKGLVSVINEVGPNLNQPGPNPTDQLMLQLATQTNQILINQQSQLDKLRKEVNQIMAGRKPDSYRRQRNGPVISGSGQQLRLTGIPDTNQQPSAGTRAKIIRRIDDYCERYGVPHQETWNYLYKRLYEVHAINVHRLIRIGRESIIDALERYGHLERLYKLTMAELVL